MPRKQSKSNGLLEKSQRGHSRLGKLNVLPLPELPLFAAACQTAKEPIAVPDPNFMPTPEFKAFFPEDEALSEAEFNPGQHVLTLMPEAASSAAEPFEQTRVTVPAAPEPKAIVQEPFGGLELKPHLAGVPLTAESIRAAIFSWKDLRPSQRAPLLTAINHVESILRCAPAVTDEVPPWSCAGLNRVLWARPRLAYGLGPDAFRSMLTCLRKVLIRLGAHADTGHGRNKLTAPWGALYAALPSDEYRKGLVRFFRFLTLEGITPETIGDDCLGRFDTWCRTKILYEDPIGLTRRTAGNWEFARHHVVGWPRVNLSRSEARDHYALPWEEFPPEFLADVERYLKRLAAGPSSPFKAVNPYAELARAKAQRKSLPANQRSGRRAQRPRTIETRRWQIKVAASSLVLSGVPAKELTSLASLAESYDRIQTILDFHRERLRKRLGSASDVFDEAELRSSNLKGIGEALRQIAKYEARLPEHELEDIRDLIAFVSPEEQLQMSEKNARRLRQLFAEPAYARLLNLPTKWVTKDARDPLIKPDEAARIVMFAAALEILTFLPLRRANVLQLRLDRHLWRPRPNAPLEEIHLASHEVKNGKPIVWPIPPEGAKLLETYIQEYRPLLTKFGNPFLFPGVAESHRNDCEFGATFSKRVSEAIGAEFNCHLIRHFSAVRYLRAFPGAYEIAAHILGHKNPDTTRRFYCGLEIDAAARSVNALLRSQRRETELAGLMRPGRSSRRTTKRESKS